MRIAANSGPYYSERARDARVTVDGVVVEKVLEADEEAGWADVLLTSPDQSLPKPPADVRYYVREHEQYGGDAHPRFRVARLTGDVRITFDEEDAA